MTKGFDTDRSFMLVEIAGDEFYFQAVSRTGQTVDSDMLVKKKSESAPLVPASQGIPSAADYRIAQVFQTSTSQDASTRPVQ
jgi:hypothetical protein